LSLSLTSLTAAYKQRIAPTGVEPSQEEGDIDHVEHSPTLSIDFVTAEVPIESVPEPTPEPTTAHSAAELRVINKVQTLDLKQSDLQTPSQRALAAIDIWVEENKIEKFVINPKVASSKLPKPVRSRLREILDVSDRELLESWRLYRQVKCGARCLLAIQRVRRGELRSNSACMDYDANGWNPSPSRRGITKATIKAKAAKPRASQLLKREELLKSGAGSVDKAQRTSTTAAAEQTQAVIGGLHIKLVKFEKDFANDREVLTLVKNMRKALDPHYQEIKRIVLRRARKKTNKRRARRGKAGRNTTEGGDQ
jgi:hypothetical protein